MKHARPRWLIVADSLALPRPGLGYEHSWPYLLQRAYPERDWVVLARRGSTTQRLLDDGEGGGDTLEFYAPDGVVLQLGICDCAPRLFGLWADRLLRLLPSGVASLVVRLKKRCIGRSDAHALVSPARFAANLHDYLQRCSVQGVRVLVWPILPPGSAMVDKNPAILEAAGRYNSVMAEICSTFPGVTLLQPYAAAETAQYTMEDGYHLNEAGNGFVFEQVARCL